MAGKTPLKKSPPRNAAGNQSTVPSQAGKSANALDRNIKREQINKQGLNFERERRVDRREYEDINNKVEIPSKGRFYLGLTLAGVGDILDIVALFTVIGELLEWIVDVFIDIPLVWLGFKAGKDAKTLTNASSLLNEKMESLNQKINQYRALYDRLSRLSKKSKFIEKKVQKAALKLRNLKKVIAKNPLVKRILASIADLIPILDALPFRSLSVYLDHKAAKKSYEQWLTQNQEYIDMHKQSLGEQKSLLEIQDQLAEEEYYRAIYGDTQNERT